MEIDFLERRLAGVSSSTVSESSSEYEYDSNSKRLFVHVYMCT